MNESQLNKLLESVKNTPSPEFPSAETFKKNFFEKARTIPVEPKKSKRKLIFVSAGIAAMFTAVCGIAYQSQTHVDHQERYLSVASPQPPALMEQLEEKSKILVMQESGHQIQNGFPCAPEPKPAPVMAVAETDVDLESWDGFPKLSKRISVPAAFAMNSKNYKSRMRPISNHLQKNQTAFDARVAQEAVADAFTSGEGIGKFEKNGLIITRSPMPESHESYRSIAENGWRSTIASPLSTFSANADAGSYANIRRILNSRALPQPDAVRIEELINYFSYNYPAPQDSKPLQITPELGKCPWDGNSELLRIALKARNIDKNKAPASNLVFLIDVSGSMDKSDKLPLLKSAFKMLVSKLRSNDRVAIVTYAGNERVALYSTPGHEKAKILSVLKGLDASGSTAGGAGIQAAYRIAKKNFIEDGNNRVILATDGDFNVGVASDAELVRLIEEKRKSGIFLTALGFGMGNYKDAKLEQLAQKGNGNFAYIDTLFEAKKYLVKEFTSTLFTVAKDVKIQVEFNPAKVDSYRLIGFENRSLNAEDFKNDQVDANEMGAGHSATAIYQIIRRKSPLASELKYTQTTLRATPENNTEIATVKVRCKMPDGDESTEYAFPAADRLPELNTEDFRFAVGVAMFGQLLRKSEYRGNSSYPEVIKQLKAAKGTDEEGYRAECIRLAETAELLEKK